MELQVSTSKLFGFHVFIDELQLDENTIKPASRSLGQCPNDYVQFGRDTFYVTTSTSGRYCGTMEKVTITAMNEKSLLKYIICLSCTQIGLCFRSISTTLQLL